MSDNPFVCANNCVCERRAAVEPPAQLRAPHLVRRDLDGRQWLIRERRLSVGLIRGTILLVHSKRECTDDRIQRGRLVLDGIVCSEVARGRVPQSWRLAELDHRYGETEREGTRSLRRAAVVIRIEAGQRRGGRDAVRAGLVGMMMQHV